MSEMGITFTEITSPLIKFEENQLCFLQQKAVAALDTLTSTLKETLYLESAWRSTAQQHILYQYYKSGLCGITLAKKPGKSNHEGGVAIDVSVEHHPQWKVRLLDNGWSWPYPVIDPVHFEFGEGALDFAKVNLIAF